MFAGPLPQTRRLAHHQIDRSAGQDAHRVLQGLQPSRLHEHERFDFLGYTFRCRLVRSKAGALFVSFAPAVSDDAAKAIRRTIKRWRLHLRSGTTLTDLARSINAIVRGWINYYGRFYRSVLIQSLVRINDYLMRWATRKYKRLRNHPTRARELLAAIAARHPGLFAHWVHPGARPRAG